MEPGFCKHDEGTYCAVYYNSDTNTIMKKMPVFYQPADADHEAADNDKADDHEDNVEDEFIESTSFVDLIVQASLGDSIVGLPPLRCYEISAKEVKITMDYLGTTLHDYDHNRRDARDIMRQLTATCMHLYNNGVQHTDIKPSNILILPTSKRVTLIDFNLMSFVHRAKDAFAKPVRKWSRSYGTWNFCSPEIVNHKTPSDTSMVWSLAMVMMYCYSKFPLPKGAFKNSKEMSSRKRWADVFKALKNIDESNYPLFEQYAKDLPEDLHNVFERATRWDPSERMTIHEMYRVFCHPDDANLELPPIPSLHAPDSIECLEGLKGLMHKACAKLRTPYLFKRASDLFERCVESEAFPRSPETAGACIVICLYLIGLYIYDDPKMEHILGKFFGSKEELNANFLKIGNHFGWRLIAST